MSRSDVWGNDVLERLYRTCLGIMLKQGCLPGYVEVCQNSVCKGMICSKQSERDWNNIRAPQVLWNGQPRQVGCNGYLVMMKCRMLLMLENRRFRKNRILVFQEKRSYTHLNDKWLFWKIPFVSNEIERKKYGER